MHAIILVFDEAEIHTVYDAKFSDIKHWIKKLLFKVRLNYPGWLLKVLSSYKDVKCFGLRDCGFNKVLYLLKYLRKKLYLRGSNISILRSSCFEDNDSLMLKLKSIITEHKNEDLFFYYYGHSLKDSWGWGEDLGKKMLFFKDFSVIFNDFAGRLIFIDEGCHSLALDSYLKKLRIKYLLFGISREHQLGLSNHSVLRILITAWSKRKPAYPKVIKACLLRGRRKVDLVDDIEDLFTKKPMECRDTYYHFAYSELSLHTNYSKCRGPSLRRGLPLDHLCFPKER